MFYLILYPCKPHQSVIELNTSQLRLGRDPSCHLCLHENGVSSKHAQFEKYGQGYALRDLGSTNGTEINGENNSFQSLKHNDVIRIGDVELRFSFTGILDPIITPVPTNTYTAETGSPKPSPVTPPVSIAEPTPPAQA